MPKCQISGLESDILTGFPVHERLCYQCGNNRETTKTVVFHLFIFRIFKNMRFVRFLNGNSNPENLKPELLINVYSILFLEKILAVFMLSFSL